MKTEEKVAHTPGIWKAVAVDESAEYKQWEIQPHVGVVERVDGIGEANARLIAAAPELLEALERCLDRMIQLGAEDEPVEGETIGPCSACQAARAAISKAKGLSQ
jgi:hypothetical protein